MPDGQLQRMTGAVVPAASRVVIVVSKGPDPSATGAVIPTPDVLRAQQGDALGKLQEAGLNARVVNDYSDRVARGRVVAQLPAGGIGAPMGSDAHLIVSSGPPAAPPAEVPLPDVVGSTEAEAVGAIQAAGLSPQIAYAYHPTVPAGIVAEQLPNRDSIAALGARKSRAWVWVVAAVAVVALAVAAFAFLLGGTAPVPDVVGLTQEEAIEVIAASGFVVGDVESAEQADAPAGTVLEQSPAAGDEARAGSAIDLVIAGEPAAVAVPDVVGMSEAEAKAALEAVGLVATATRARSATIDAGLVASQAPQAGAKVAPGTEVGIVVSEGAQVQLVEVPDLAGMTEAEAEKALEDAGLVAFKAENASDEVPDGEVIAQVPAAGDEVAPGTTVAIVISTGPPANPDVVEVPNVVGMELADAQETLAEAGFQPLPVKTGTTGDAGTVVAQTPAAGAEAQRGSAVVVFYIGQ